MIWREFRGGLGWRANKVAGGKGLFRGRRGRSQGGWRHPLWVVPAKAGTHNHSCSWSISAVAPACP